MLYIYTYRVVCPSMTPSLYIFPSIKPDNSVEVLQKQQQQPHSSKNNPALRTSTTALGFTAAVVVGMVLVFIALAVVVVGVICILCGSRTYIQTGRQAGSQADNSYSCYSFAWGFSLIWVCYESSRKSCVWVFGLIHFVASSRRERYVSDIDGCALIIITILREQF